jgi:hypothetical protein
LGTTQEPTSWVWLALALLGITLLPGRSGLLNHLPLDSRLRLLSEANFILTDSRLELSYSDSRLETLESGQLRERHAFNMTKKGSQNRSLSKIDGVTASLQPYKPPPGLHSNYTRFFSTIANIANRAICIVL